MCVSLYSVLYVTISVLEEYFGFLLIQGDVLVPSSAWFLETKATLFTNFFALYDQMKCTLFLRNMAKHTFKVKHFPTEKFVSLCGCQTVRSVVTLQWRLRETEYTRLLKNYTGTSCLKITAKTVKQIKCLILYIHKTIQKS